MPALNHAVASHVQEEVAFLGHVAGQEDVVLDVLLGQDGDAGRHVAHHRDGEGVAALGVGLGVIDELDGAGFARIPLDQTPALQLVQVVVDG